MFITENYNLHDSLLFDMACRESLCLLVGVSSVDKKSELKRYITKEAPSYEILSLVIDGKLPEKKFTVENERALFERFKTMMLINYSNLTKVIGESITNELINNVDTLSILNEAEGQSAPPASVMNQLSMTAGRSGIGVGVGYTVRNALMASTSGTGGLMAALGTAFQVLSVGAIIAAMVYASYKIYKNYLTKAAKACAGKEGTEKKMCMKEYEIQGLNAQITDLRRGLAGCAKTKKPEKCREGLNKKIMGIQKKLDLAKTTI